MVAFGFGFRVDELVAGVNEDAFREFDVQMVTYRAGEIAGGLLLCSVMNMWTLGCLLFRLHFVSGKRLFSTAAVVKTSMQERVDNLKVEGANHLG